nr:hypothetical protein [Tanacetum cinerariifolium]
SLAKKKAQLRQMFTSDEWEKCKFFKTVKGKAAYASVVASSFWNGVTLCLNVFAPLVKVLRMVDADWKPSMGFIYGELKKAKQEIMDALNNNEKSFPLFWISSQERHLDDDLNDAIVELAETLFGEDYNMQNQITLHEFPMYKGKLEKFSRAVAIKGCEVNDEKYDPALWWSMYGSSTPILKKITMRILSLTTSSSGCERNWSTFEGGEVREDGVEAGLPRETVSDDMGTWTSARLRELYEEEFESEGEVEVDEEFEYESDGVQIIEQYGPDEDGASI